MKPPGAPERGPGHQAAIRGRNAIEEALLLLPAIEATLDRTGARDRLLRAIQCMYLAMDAPLLSVAHVEAIGQAIAASSECVVLLERAREAGPSPALDHALAWLDEGIRALREGHEAVVRVQYERRSELIDGAIEAGVPAPKPFRASIGAPQLHCIARAPLLPHILVDPPGEGAPAPPGPRVRIERPTTVEGLAELAEAAMSGAIERRIEEAEAAGPKAPPAAPAPEAWVYEPALEEAEMLRRLARDCLEDIASHRTLRKPNAMETWRDQAPFEQRLLDNLDALVALGGAVLPLVALYQAEAKIPDPERAFAMALVLGAIEGSDAAAAAVLGLKQSAPETYPGWLEGFQLAPSPAIDAVMADLATAGRTAWVAFALDVLHARGGTPDDIVRLHLSSADPPVLARAARALSTCLPRDEAVDALGRIAAAPLDDEVLLSALQAMLVRGHGPALASLRDLASGDAGAPRTRRAAWLLSLSGQASDLDLLLRVAQAAPEPTLARGLGRFGHVGVLPRLVELLGSDDAEVVEAAAEALDRITGAGLREVVEEPWDVDIAPELLERGLPVPRRKRQRVAVDAAAWSRWLAKHGSQLDPGRRTRAGTAFLPVQIVDELSALETPPARRAEAAEELSIALGPLGGFSTGDWVARQAAMLVDLRARAAGRGAPARPPELPSFLRATMAGPGRPSDDGDAPPITLDSDEIDHAPKASLPFLRPAAPGTPPWTAIPLERYASLCAELMVFPEAAGAILRRYGIEDRDKWALVDAAWRERLGREPDQVARWNEMYWRHLIALARRGGPPG